MDPIDKVFRLQAGPISAELYGAELRDVRIAGHIAFDGLYAAVRDTAWGTVPAEISGLEIDQRAHSFVVKFCCAHPTVGFTWLGCYEAGDGRLQLHLDGLASRDVAVNRVGFCLLHPIELAGTDIELTTSAGAVWARFPEPVAPEAVATDLRTLGYDIAPGIHVEARFGDDRYEIEDHRNWTDAGWKTYSPPLGTPRPTMIRAGDRVERHIDIQTTLAPAVEWVVDSAPSVRVGEAIVGRLPQVALVVDERSDPAAVAAVGPCGLSVHLREDGEWRASLTSARQLATQLDIPLGITMIGSPAWTSRIAMDVAPTRPSRVAVSEPEAFVPLPGMVTSVRAALRAAGCEAQVGGASTLFFAELNRMSLPTEPWDFAAFPVTPQVHHTDDVRILETVRAQPYAVAGAALLAGGIPVVVEPIAFRARRTPVLPAALSDPRDPRESEPLGVAWLLGCASGLARAETMTYLVDLRPADSSRPDLAMIRLLASHAGERLLDVTCDTRRLAAIALGGRSPGVGTVATVIVANLVAVGTSIEVNGVPVDLGPHGTATIEAPLH